MSQPLIELDGTIGEGGGQVLRTSLTLSLLTGKGFHLANIRAGRSKPGLQPQHLQSVLASARIGNAHIRGASLGSTDLVFEPGPVQAGCYHFNIGTAGSTGLVLHTIALPLALAGGEPSEVSLIGGTHVTTSPSFHFNDRTWRQHLQRLGVSLTLRLDRPGFYPRGGGLVRVFVQPSAGLRGRHLPSRGEVSVSGISAVAGLDSGIARRQARRARQLLEAHDLDVQLDEQTWEGGPGSVLVLEVQTGDVPAVFVGLGARGKPAERVAEEAVAELLDYVRAGSALVDAHSGDQLLLPLALAEGPSSYEVAMVTRHLTTNIAVIGHFLHRPIRCIGNEGEPGRVEIL